MSKQSNLIVVSQFGTVSFDIYTNYYQNNSNFFIDDCTLLSDTVTVANPRSVTMRISNPNYDPQYMDMIRPLQGYGERHCTTYSNHSWLGRADELNITTNVTTSSNGAPLFLDTYSDSTLTFKPIYMFSNEVFVPENSTDNIKTVISKGMKERFEPYFKRLGINSFTFNLVTEDEWLPEENVAKGSSNDTSTFITDILSRANINVRIDEDWEFDDDQNATVTLKISKDKTHMIAFRLNNLILDSVENRSRSGSDYPQFIEFRFKDTVKYGFLNWIYPLDGPNPLLENVDHTIITSDNPNTLTGLQSQIFIPSFTINTDNIDKNFSEVGESKLKSIVEHTLMTPIQSLPSANSYIIDYGHLFNRMGYQVLETVSREVFQPYLMMPIFLETDRTSEEQSFAGNLPEWNYLRSIDFVTKKWAIGFSNDFVLGGN